MLTKVWLLFPKASEDLRTQLLKNRGITKNDYNDFLHPNLTALASPEDLFPDILLAVERIKKAVVGKDLIFIYGDYDVDGITGSAILWETLDFLGAKVLPYIPERHSEGYGLNNEALKKIAGNGAKVVVSVDCGITAVEQAKYAKSLGLDLIITDHHQPREALPQPFALLHTTTLSGSGVAFRLASELLRAFGKENDEQFFKNLELATLGTVSDMVPLIGDNRVIVSNGLPLLSKSSRLGLNSLYSEASVGKVISTYEIGFVISPRLNAMGRMESALDSLRLLLTKDKTRADALASKLGRINRVRQEATIKSFEHAKKVIEKKYLGSKLFIVSSVDYPEGVLGLVAGKISEAFHRPAAAISENQMISKGSARSIRNFNITTALANNSQFLVSHGGHPMAAGFSLQVDNIPPFREAMMKLADSMLKKNDLLPFLKIDKEIKVSDVNEELVDLIKEFEPFGVGNPEPLFLTKGLEVLEVKTVGKQGNHIKLVLQDKDHNLLEGVGFNLVEKIPPTGDLIDIVYSISENYWNSRKRIEARVKDLRKAGDK